jgi:hypothetical protein
MRLRTAAVLVGLASYGCGRIREPGVYESTDTGGSKGESELEPYARLRTAEGGELSVGVNRRGGPYRAYCFGSAGEAELLGPVKSHQVPWEEVESDFGLGAGGAYNKDAGPLPPEISQCEPPGWTQSQSLSSCAGASGDPAPVGPGFLHEGRCCYALPDAIVYCIH